MPSLGIQVVVGILLLLMALYGSLGFTYPQLAFRLENIFQLRSVELSGFGLIAHKIGGLILIGITIVIPFGTGYPLLVLPAIVGAVVPPLYFQRTRGTPVVQSMNDPAITHGVNKRN